MTKTKARKEKFFWGGSKRKKKERRTETTEEKKIVPAPTHRIDAKRGKEKRKKRKETMYTDHFYIEKEKGSR